MKNEKELGNQQLISWESMASKIATTSEDNTTFKWWIMLDPIKYEQA